MGKTCFKHQPLTTLSVLKTAEVGANECLQTNGDGDDG